MVQAITTIINTNKPTNVGQGQHSIQNGFSTPSTMLPQEGRNYCLFNMNKINFIISQKENALPLIKQTLQTSNDEKEIIEALYITDKLIDNGVKGMPLMYPYFAKFNDTKSPNIQVYLAGIYRKTQIPDGFGPLISMLIKNTKLPENEKSKIFDPNEEIGGAILEYLRNYSNNPKKIDYSA